MSNHIYTNFHGILLYRKPYKEHDLLIKFLTAEAGKKMFFVRGAMKPRFKMTADILPFTYGEYSGNLSPNGLSYIISALDISHYNNISQNIDLNAYATYIMGLIDAAFPDSTPIFRWFNQLFYGLRLIDHGIDPAIITNIFEIQLLPVFGVAPQLKHCVICGRSDLPMDFSEIYGGLLCENHFSMDPRRMHFDKRTIYYLRKFSVINLKQIRSIKVHHQVKQNLRMLLDDIYKNEVGLNLKSKHFLDQMNRFHI
ncbi:DNA repair protein RecO [Philodulcilactobacillus myokoensis]|uniref:DNA repair protein RecO n=1 Tax=Philodulcilactobacillus myokoensis TaxID=2929573 RepID=A0A9W6B1G3_9LACO|nr:DNA repair protein RecO [Philodulcilactobacillus myokoensis]GLB46908.1 DNA repair protein RecO [Philodulcilactobacillus myokoensis]